MIHNAALRLPGALLAAVALLACNSPAKIEMRPQPLVLKRKGEVRTLDVSVRDRRGNVLADAKPKFTSLTPEVVSVDDHGAVVARRTGDGKVLVTAGEVSATAAVRVRIAARIVIEPRNPVLNVGVSAQLSATVYDDKDEPLVSAMPIQWSVSDPSVVVLRDDGAIKTVKEGRATVTAFVGDIRATTVITVRHEKYDKKTGTWSQ